MNHINLFLILLILLIILLFFLVLLLVVFRKSIERQCCGSRSEEEEEDSRSHRGLRNLAFDDHEHPGLISARPFSNMEVVDTPPSYDEAIKQELFRFGLPPSQSLRPHCTAGSSTAAAPSTSSSEERAATLTPTSLPRHSIVPNQPSTSHGGGSHSPRSRSSTGSSCLASQLSTIEEESDECPVTVVIDCIGIQASRLIDKCDTSVNLTDGSELSSHSKC